jgi:hypothetical protein
MRIKHVIEFFGFLIDTHPWAQVQVFCRIPEALYYFPLLYTSFPDVLYTLFDVQKCLVLDMNWNK